MIATSGEFTIGGDNPTNGYGDVVEDGWFKRLMLRWRPRRAGWAVRSSHFMRILSPWPGGGFSVVLIALFGLLV